MKANLLSQCVSEVAKELGVSQQEIWRALAKA